MLLTASDAFHLKYFHVHISVPVYESSFADILSTSILTIFGCATCRDCEDYENKSNAVKCLLFTWIDAWSSKSKSGGLMSNEFYRVMKKIWNNDDNTAFMRKVRRDNDDMQNWNTTWEGNLVIEATTRWCYPSLQSLLAISFFTSLFFRPRLCSTYCWNHAVMLRVFVQHFWEYTWCWFAVEWL